MAVFAGPEIVNDGLVLNIDAANIRCYSGVGNTIIDLSTAKTNFSLFDASGFIASDNVFRFVYQANGTASNWITTSNFNTILSGNVSTFSYCGFVKVTDANSNKCWTFDNLNNDTTNRINFYVSPNGPSLEINNVAGNVPTLPGVSALNTWAFYALTIENSGLTWKLYRWNTSTSSLQSNTSTVTTPGTIGSHITFGRRGAATSNFCGMDMGIQLMYNRTLNTTELSQVFNAYRGRYIL
jgi:hypothetical protein